MQNWIPYALKSLKILLLVMVVCVGFMALDASAEEQVFDVMMEKYKDVASKWQGIMFNWAQLIFWPLALMSLSWRLIQRSIDGVDIAGLFREIFWPGFFIGFYYYLLVNGSSIGAEILSVFMRVASEGSEITGMSNLAFSPSGIMSMANEIWWEVLRTSGKGLVYSLIPGTESGMFANLLGIFVSFGVWVLLAMVAIDVLILLIASWVLLYGGLIILAFGGGFGFGLHQYALNYFRSVVALGLQLLGTGLIVTVGLSVMQTDLISFRQGFNLQTLMSFLLCAMAMKMVVGSIPPMLAGMINGNVGALGPKGEGVIGGLVGAGVTAATTTVSLGMGAAASAKMHAAQAGLDRVKNIVSGRNMAQTETGPGVSMPNSISAATGDEQTSQTPSYAKAMGHDHGSMNIGQNTATPMGESSTGSSATSASTGTTSTGQANSQSVATPVTGAASTISKPTSDFTAPMGQPMGTTGELGASEGGVAGGISSDSLNAVGDLGASEGISQQDFIAPQPKPSDSSNLASLPDAELLALQKGFEDQIRQMSAKRDYHYASARSSFVTGAKTLFNYMAFFNNRGYF